MLYNLWWKHFKVVHVLYNRCRSREKLHFVCQVRTSSLSVGVGVSMWMIKFDHPSITEREMTFSSIGGDNGSAVQTTSKPSSAIVKAFKYCLKSFTFVNF